MSSNASSTSGGSSGYNSPLRQAEKYADDLKHERRMASLALQEKTRLTIEVDSLKQRIEGLRSENAELRDALVGKSDEIETLQQKLEMSDNSIMQLKDAMVEAQKNVDFLASKSLNYQQEKDIILAENRSYRESIGSLENKLRLTESVQLAGDQSLSELNAELHQLRWKYGESDKTIEYYKQLYHESQCAVDDLKKQVSQNNLVHEKLTNLQLSYTDLKRSYESTLKQAMDLESKEKAGRAEIDELKKVLAISQEDQMKLKEDFDRCSRDNRDLETARDELLKHLQAEKDKLEVIESKVNTASKSKSFMEQHIQQLEAQRDQSQNRELELENELSIAKERNCSLQLEIGDLRDEVSRLKVIESTAESATHMALEIEILKTSLLEYKKKLAKREIDDNSYGLNEAPNKLAADKENQTRKVYENIIIDLRSDIEKLQKHSDHQLAKIEKYMIMASEYENLKVELSMYKDASQIVTMEKESYAITAAESAERNAQVNHDKDGLIREVIQLGAELQLKNDEVNRLKSELDSERSKKKEFYNEKLISDRKLAEFVAAKNKVEASYEDERQMRLIDKAEIERTSKISSDLKEINATLNLQFFQLEQNHLALGNKYEILSSEYEALIVQLEDSKLHLLTMQQSLKDVSGERDHLLKKIKGMKTDSESLSSQIKRLVSEIEVLKNDKEGLRRNAIKLESLVNAEALNSIRNNIGEAALQSAQEEINELTAELSKEKERYALLKSQLEISEERVDTLNKELGVFRSVAVYKYSMSKELSSIRERSSIGSSGSSNTNDNVASNIASNNEDNVISSIPRYNESKLNLDDSKRLFTDQISGRSLTGAPYSRQSMSLADLGNELSDKCAEVDYNINRSYSNVDRSIDVDELSDEELIRKRKQDRRMLFMGLNTSSSKQNSTISSSSATSSSTYQSLSRQTAPPHPPAIMRSKVAFNMNDTKPTYTSNSQIKSIENNLSSINYKRNTTKDTTLSANSHDNKSRIAAKASPSEPLKYDFERAKRILGNL